MQAIKIAHHEVAVRIIERLRCPISKLGCSHTFLVLPDRLVDQKPFSDRSELGVDHMKLEIGMLLLDLISSDAGCRIRTGKRARKREQHRRLSFFVGLLEYLEEFTERYLRSGRLIAAAHRFIEIMRSKRSIHIIGMRA